MLFKFASLEYLKVYVSTSFNKEYSILPTCFTEVLDSVALLQADRKKT